LYATTDIFSYQIFSMKNYYVNNLPQRNGDHEVHLEHCSFLPLSQNRTYLGSFSNCNDAVKEAKKHYKQVDGCYYCSKECHTQ
jgi:hypothetical protein